MWSHIEKDIADNTGRPFRVVREQAVGGGSINDAYRISGDGEDYFVKLNDASRLDMFEAEAEGLREIAAAEVIRVPRPVCWGTAGRQAYIVLEYLELAGGGARAMLRFGEQFAHMHRVEGTRHGWYRDNTIGSTPQINTPSEDWVAFWRERRLGFQLELAGRKGYGGGLQKKGERLMGDLEAFFSDYRPRPSLLHGDLWSGNYAIDRQGRPVIFDPALYYGDREADLAMTELFGGFGGAFYDAYNATYPLDAGYATRKVLYNLYHILNHLNLFGSGYQGQAERMLDRLLSELR